VMISMGFATLENILYVIFRDGGSSVAFMRMFTAVPAHAAFAVMMGYFVGLSRFATTKRKSVLYFLLALLLPMTTHGLYDFFIFQKVSHYLVIVTFATLILSLLMGFRLISRHQEHSLNSENTDKSA
jgi:protease PrsW